MISWSKSLLLAVITVSLFGYAGAQTPQADDEDLQQWNDVQIAIGLSKKVDLLFQTTLRLSNNITKVAEARGGVGIAFKPTESFSVSPSYLYIESRNSAGRFLTEHRYSLRGTYKFPIKKFGLSHRSMYEYRVRGSGNSWRYRPSLTLEKALPEKLIPRAKLFVTEEIFYVSTTRAFSRNRFSLGVRKTLSDHLTLELYYLRQNDGFSHPGDLNVLGTSWKIHF